MISFSGAPLRLITRLGLASAASALGLAAWVFQDAYTHRSAPHGWASTIVIVLFMGSVHLISLGVIGEYVRLIFQECKGRPTYVVGEYRPALSAERAEAADKAELVASGSFKACSPPGRWVPRANTWPRGNSPNKPSSSAGTRGGGRGRC